MKSLRRYYIFIIFLGVLVGLTLVRRDQYMRSLAQTPADVGTVKVLTEKLEGKENVSRINVMFRTGTAQDKVEAISSLAMRIYIKGQDSASLQIVDKGANESDKIEISSELPVGEWRFPVNFVTKNEDGIVIDFAAINITKDGYLSSEYRKLATFYIKNDKEESDFDLTFDNELSFMYSKRRPTTNIWDATK
ncbi:MAG: hypothetical protein UT08_C0007G0002 [Candidatus Woesebacteria bacterium GW2011_GWB1_38_8]|uniref:Uncharacterized protein n=1 Tax=Candidatus Woesebacteria bacterium GW2011_GWB1_38_8 TaxID=1618570 RepID=A0A0G0NHG1_9BACT|nr:MAG: hypothetical protein UT08_C0007G0002 [Candidatus Woesebacteria bacterium GW2011_GWB1_38_8]